MKKISTILIVLLFSVCQGYSQTDTKAQMAKIMNRLSKEEQALIKKSDKFTLQGNNAYKDAMKVNAEIEKYKAQGEKAKRKIKSLEIKSVEKQFKASGYFEQSHDLIAGVFRINLMKNRPKNDEKRLALGKLLEKEAVQHLNAAKSLRRKLNKQTSCESITQMVKDIDDLEHLGIEKYIKVYGIYLAWPETLEEFKQDLSPDLPPIDTTTTVVVVPVDPNANNNNNVPENPKAKIVFKVQILATRKEATPERLRTFYTGSEPIEKQMEEGWFKYSIGNYESYEKAAELRKTIKTTGPFVVAYRDGVRIDIVTALDAIK